VELPPARHNDIEPRHNDVHAEPTEPYTPTGHRVVQLEPIGYREEPHEPPMGYYGAAPQKPARYRDVPEPMDRAHDDNVRHPMLYIPHPNMPVAVQLTPVAEVSEPMLHSPHSASTASPHSDTGFPSGASPPQPFNGFPGVPLACTCCDDPGMHCDGGNDDLDDSVESYV